MTTVIPIEDLRRSPAAPSLHFHPYPEVFLVEAGVGSFTVVHPSGKTEQTWL